ncbi:hypothetical protein ACFWP5_40670 [Streptomyces sp. NPDC058469]|uniref:hypothetical protein n=1 Tax=Streptomyces sp. NPDC058469 TaxID=3346514 RepID=UPI0036677768
MTIAAAVFTGCSGDGKPSSAGSQLDKPGKAADAATTVRLAWNHTGTFFDEPQVWYVARVKNPGRSNASVALDARALDEIGTIVGSDQAVLPNIPAGASFDYFGGGPATPGSRESRRRCRSPRPRTPSDRPALLMSRCSEPASSP